jgi:SAM-dependent methyltransferase
VTSGTTPLDYSAWTRSRLGRVTERLERAAILELAGPLDGLDVLDVGTGDGAHAVALADEGARITGVDVSIPALHAASFRVSEPGTRLRLVAADALSLPFRTGSFDLAIAVTALCFTRSPERAVAEIGRVLRPGGRLVIGELGRWSTWAAWRRIRGWFGSPSWRDTRFWTSAGLRRLARGAGLSPGRVRGAVFYPPLGLAAAALACLDPVLGRGATIGAAFLATTATKPGVAANDLDRPLGSRAT